MKLLFFDDWKLGVLKGDTVVDVSAVVTGIPHTGPHNLISGLIERFADHKARLEEAVARGQGVPVSRVKVRPPLPKPGSSPPVGGGVAQSTAMSVTSVPLAAPLPRVTVQTCTGLLGCVSIATL